MNESLVKYLSGLLDADGSLSFKFRVGRNTGDHGYLSLMLSLSASTAVDERGFVESLPAQTGMGTVSRYGDKSQFTRWDVVRSADIEKLLPRLVKHMLIKGRHWDWMLNEWREKKSARLSPVEFQTIQDASKASRKSRSGPLKPKNHPTWAWLAGYLDGDGWYRYKKYQGKDGYGRWMMRCGAVAHESDAHVLQFIQNAFGGTIGAHSSETPHIRVWDRNLGASEKSFALRFLPNVAKHSRLKRHKIDQLVHHHQQRLSDPAPAGEATV